MARVNERTRVYDSGGAMSESTTFEKVLGERVRAAREARGWTQDELARAIRFTGLGWTRAVVASIERGTHELTFPELVVLFAAVGMNLDQALTGAGELVLVPGAIADGDTLAEAFGRGELEGAVRFERIERLQRAAAAGFEFRNAQTKRIWPSATFADRIRAERAMGGDTERRAARKLGIDPFEVSLLALRLFGTSLTEKRDELVGEDRPPESRKAYRGRATRALVDQLAEALAKTKGRK